MSVLKTNFVTKITGLLILLTVIFTIVSQEKWNKPNEIITADVRGYYAYLPALFIHNDLKFEDHEVYKKEKGYEVWVSEDKNGVKFIKYTCGMSIMYSPFFLIAHNMAEPLGQEANGFTYPYKIGLIVGSIFYLFIGLLFLSKFLLRYFEDHIVSTTLIILYLGTNMFEFETSNPTFSHTYSFALITLFLYSTVKWLDKPKLKWAIWIGISGGLMFLIRPIDIIFLSFIPLFNISSFQGLKDRFSHLWKYRIHAFVFIGFFILMILPQLLYFKHIFGSFIYYSYSDEGFFFLHPHLFDSVFSYRNGWLVYSPIMIFALLGLFFVKRYAKEFKLFSPFAFLIYFYVISSWWCWWYVGFGNRAFINVYPILAIALCAFVAFISSKKFIVKLGFNLLVIAFIVLNLFQSFQYTNGIIHWGYMSKDAYWDAWGRTHSTQLQELYLRKPDLLEAKKGRDVVSVPTLKTLLTIENDFENLKSKDSSFYPFVQSHHSYSGDKALFFAEGSQYMINTKFRVPKNTTHIFATYNIKRTGPIVMVVDGTENKPFYFLSGDIYEIGGEWETMEMFAPLPRDKKDRPDSVTFYLWNQSLEELHCDDLQIKCFNLSYKDVER